MLFGGRCVDENAIYLSDSGMQFPHFQIIKHSSLFHDVSTPYVGKCGGYRGWNRDGSLGSCENGMHEMGKDLVGTQT